MKIRGATNCRVDLLFSLLRLSILTIDSRCVDKKLKLFEEKLEKLIELLIEKEWLKTRK